MIKTKYIIEMEKDENMVLIHLITFGIIVLNKSNKEKWISNDFNRLCNSTKEELLRKKFLLENEEDEKELLHYAKSVFSKRKKIIPTAVIYLTNDCNLRCSYCYTGYENEKSNEVINEVDVEKIFSAIKELYRIEDYRTEKPWISLFGGEPLLSSNINMIKHLIDKLNEYKYEEFEIVTNLINVRLYAKIFKEFQGDISLRVTLNGERKTHDNIRKFINGKGTYDIVMDNIEYVLSNLPNALIELSILLEKSVNIEGISELFSEIQERGFFESPRFSATFGHIQFRSNYVCPGFEDRVIEVADYYPMIFNFKKAIPQIKDTMISGSSMYILKAIYNSIVYNTIVTPSFTGCDCVRLGRLCFFTDGYIYPCFDCVGMREFAIGEYRDDFRLYNFCDELKKFSVKDLEKCNDCKFVGICNGGCIITNISKNGNINDVFCENVESAFIKFLDYLYSELPV
jgi:uncharacterized protein